MTWKKYSFYLWLASLDTPQILEKELAKHVKILCQEQRWQNIKVEIGFKWHGMV